MVGGQRHNAKKTREMSMCSLW